MGTYRAPLEDMGFVIDELLDAGGTLGSLPAYEEFGVGPELTTALLNEGGKLAADVMAPLRRSSHPRKIAAGHRRTPERW